MLFKTKKNILLQHIFFITPLGLHQWINDNYTIVLLSDIVSGNKMCQMITNNNEVNKI